MPLLLRLHWQWAIRRYTSRLLGESECNARHLQCVTSHSHFRKFYKDVSVQRWLKCFGHRFVLSPICAKRHRHSASLERCVRGERICVHIVEICAYLRGVLTAFFDVSSTDKRRFI